jgi:hypothetical protein
MEGHEPVSLRYVGFPRDELMGTMRAVKVSEQHFPHVGHVVEGESGHFVVIYHAVERVGAGAMVSDHAKIRGVRFGNSMSRHGVHPWKKIATEGCGETLLCNLNVALFADERRFTSAVKRRSRASEAQTQASFIGSVKNLTL